MGGRKRVNLLHTANAAGHAAIHFVRSEASVAADGGAMVFMPLAEGHEHYGVGKPRSQSKRRRGGCSAGEVTQRRHFQAITI